MTETSTPLMRQYAAIKKEHPHALLFFRLGDFYELFFEDAVVAARELQITLTSRNKEKGVSVPMCGVPYHAAEGYISKLIRKGFKSPFVSRWKIPGWRKSWCAARLRAWSRRARHRILRSVPKRTTSWVPLREWRTGWVLQRWISRPGSFEQRNFTARRRGDESRKSWPSFAPGNCCTHRLLLCWRPRVWDLFRKRRPGLVRRDVRSRRWKTECSRPTMPFSCSEITLGSCRWKDSGWRGN